MSKFINTTHKQSLDSLVEGFKEKINNPYYLHMDKKPSLVTYFQQNIEQSTLDESLKINYSHLNEQSSIKYNKIEDFYVYGLERAIIDIENGEWGLESTGIEGDGIILPNTIIPIPNDYFIINCIKDNNLLFKVTNVTVNTIENGANLYKINYKLDRLTDEHILDQVVNEYNMVINNLGTKFNTIIRKNDYDYIDKCEYILDRLKKYYIDLFYKRSVQTFILLYNNSYFYDPYLIEFLKRNDILNNGYEYVYVAHQIPLDLTFSIDYDRTFFRAVEMPDSNDLNRTSSQGEYINAPTSLFSCRIEDYFKIKYIDKIIDHNNYIINNLSIELMDAILKNTKFINEEDVYMNIIIKHFNKEKINADDIYSLEKIDYKSNIELFYNIPIVIYIIEHSIKNLMK